jgi:hypothetical protein
MSRPSRSDAHLSPVDEAVRVAEVREYYDDAAPKRHTKPSRSEHSAVYTDDALIDSSHPELDKLQELEAHTEVRRLSPSSSFKTTSRIYMELMRVVRCCRNWCSRAASRERSSWRRSTTGTSAASASSTTR